MLGGVQSSHLQDLRNVASGYEIDTFSKRSLGKIELRVDRVKVLLVWVWVWVLLLLLLL